MSNDLEIQFGELEEAEPEVRLRPDGNKHYAVAPVYAPSPQELPVFVDLDAMQDMEDDALVGVKSSALALGARAKPAIAIFYALALALFVSCVPIDTWNGLFFAATALALAHLGWQVATLDPSDPANCLARFKANRDFGALIMLAIALSRV